MDKQQIEVPVQRDERNFEQQRHDLMKNLKQRFAKQNCDKNDDGYKVTDSMGHKVELPDLSDWLDQVKKWIQDMSHWRRHDLHQAWRHMFSLVPVDANGEDTADRRVSSSSSNYIPSILLQMDEQRRNIQQHAEQLIPDYKPELSERAKHGCLGVLLPMGGWTGGLLDYLHGAYEPGEDGQLRFKLRFDLRGYDPNDIRVVTANNRLTVHAKKTVGADDSKRTQEFCRTLYLPTGLNTDQFTSTLSQDGILTVEAPVKHQSSNKLKYNQHKQLGVQPQPETHQPALQQTGQSGVTILSDSSGGTGFRLHAEIPIEPGFRPDELHVSTVRNRLIISGMQQKEEEAESSGEKSIHVRQFERSYPIPESVDPMSLQAKLFEKTNTLIVEAPLVTKQQQK